MELVEEVRGYVGMQDVCGTRVCRNAQIHKGMQLCKSMRVCRNESARALRKKVERLTVSATRAAVSNQVGKSSFSIKELTAGACLDAFERWRQTRILSGSPGACVEIETMSGED